MACMRSCMSDCRESSSFCSSGGKFPPLKIFGQIIQRCQELVLLIQELVAELRHIIELFATGNMLRKGGEAFEFLDGRFELLFRLLQLRWRGRLWTQGLQALL